MKKQQRIKKIVLSKETLRNMDGAQLRQIAGGISGSICGNDTCFQLCQGTKYC